MEKPNEPLLAVMYEDALDSYHKAYEQADRGTYRISRYDLSKAVEEGEVSLFVDEILARIKAWQEALVIAEKLAISGKQGLQAKQDYERELWRFYEYERAKESYNPEMDNVRSVAEALVKEQAYEALRIRTGKRHKSKNWSRASWAIADKIALMTDSTRETVITQAKEFIEAHPMRFAVTTGNLTYLKAGK